jgi:hypothetical protein
MAVSMVRKSETREEALVRLAAKAREEGVKLYRDSKDGRYYASSVSTPGQMHYVTGFSCDCAGFAQHHRCKHYAALMSALGWIAAPEPKPTAPATRPAVCGTCNGLGETQYTRSTGLGRYVYDWQTCGACHGTGQASEVERMAA